MSEKSTPEADNNAAGGNEDVATQATTDDHSQDSGSEATADSTDKGGSTDATSTAKDDADNKTEAKSDDAPAFDTDLDEWAKTRGYGDLESDKERRMAQDARNNQREYTRAQQANKATNDLKKSVDEAKSDIQGDDEDENADPLERKVSSLEERYETERTMRIQSEYFSEKGVTDDEAKVMGDILKEEMAEATTKSEKNDVYKFLTNPKRLPHWHNLAKARIATSTDVSGEVEEKARANEREKLAKITQANGPARSASSTTTSDKTEDQERLERFSTW